MKIKTTSYFTLVPLIIVNLILWSYFIQPQGQAFAAYLYLNPSSGSYNTGNSFDVEIILNTGGEEAITVGSYLNYDNNRLTIQDADPNTAGVQISTENTAFEIVVVNQINASSGQVRLEGINTNTTLNGSYLLLGIITFIASNSGIADVNFSSSCFIGSATDGSNILTNTTGGSYTIESGSYDPDINGDGDVDYFDVVLFIDAYQDYVNGNTGNLTADVNEDGDVNYSDVTLFIDLYTKSQ